MNKSCRRGYKLKNGKCKKIDKKIAVENTKGIRNQIITVLILGMITAFTILIVQGIIGLFGLEKLSNLGKIFIGVIAVVVITFIGRNKLGLKI